VGVTAAVALDLAARPPYDGFGVLRWLGARLVPGVEELSDGVYRRTLRLPGGPGVVALEPRGGHVRATLRLADEADRADSVEPRVGHVRATLRLADPADRAAALAACRALLDLDADPHAHNAVLAADPALAPRVDADPGLRAPGTVDPAETAVRAVLGQQVSLAAARTLAGRLVAACGARLPERHGALSHVFPAPAAIADDGVLGAIGLPRARQRTLRELGARLAAGDLALDGGTDGAAVREQLLAIPGIGPWTADYIALRALGDPDAFPAGDLGLRRGARALGLPDDAAGLEARAERWRPWRRYAAHHLWAA
jgi:AraC family transcriptional regulator, regulatory protein of adaptative response / DNA-3-methyladenine glycosylase II